MTETKEIERRDRAKKIVAYLKRAYPVPKSELQYSTPFQFLVAVIMSAQCTDKAVNRVTDTLFKKYKTAPGFCERKSECIRERNIIGDLF